MKSPRVAFANFPADAFPIRIEAYRVSDPSTIIWGVVMKEPGALIIPPLAKIFGGFIGIHTHMNNGMCFSTEERVCEERSTFTDSGNS